MSNDFKITLTDTDKFDWVIVKVITYSTYWTREFKSCPVFPLRPESFIELWLTDRQTGETGGQKYKLVSGSNTFETSYINITQWASDVLSTSNERLYDVRPSIENMVRPEDFKIVFIMDVH